MACMYAGPSATAETIVIESRVPGGGVTANPPYQEVVGNWANSGSHTIAPGTTQINPSIGSRFASNPATTPTIRLTPTLQPNSTYRMSVSHITINASPNLVVNITYEGCTGTAASTTAFNSALGNVWETVADITTEDGTVPPAIIFTYASGTLAGTGGRWYSDAFRFQNDSCIFSTLPELVSATGPLAEGQSFVNVPGVSANATAVNVYADGVQIGQKTSGITAGLNRVDTTTPLVKGQVITATQSDASSVESCRPVSGPIVGGGANPAVRMALSIRQDTALTGPIGGNGGGTSTIIKFLGATNIVASQGAPMTTRVFYPSNEWQTVQFERGSDPANPVDSTFIWNGTDTAPTNQLKGNFGVLDSIAFAVNEDTGPYAIYIDNFMNGSTRIQSFEGAVPGTLTVLFSQPSFSGTTSPYLLSQAANVVSPNVSMVTNNTADHESHSLFVSWQFKDTNRINWLRLPAGGSGTPNPMLDLRLPISFRMLILPAGEVVAPSAPVASVGPGNQRVIRGGSVTMRINVKGTSPFTYQWRQDGADILGATSATLTLTNVQPSQAGAYTVFIENSLGSTESPSGTLTVEDVVLSDVMTPAWRLATGSRTYLANDNNTRSIAWSPATGNLLVLSRSGGVTNIYALDGNTGDFKYILQPPAGGYVGGTFVLSQVAVANNGSVYACNLTDDGTATNLKIYKWFGDFENEPGQMVWEGNPANDSAIPARWGDAMAVRDVPGAPDTHEIIVSSRTGARLSFIQPDFPSVVMVDVTTAAPNSFRLGLAAVGDDIIWGKMTGLPLLEVEIDPGFTTGTILNSYSGVSTMGPIGINPRAIGNTAAGSLLGGVFIDSPDHFRLYDISTPGSLVALDTEFFPSDNANGNATGGVAFGIDKVYALDSNNGIIAMNLNTDCLPDRLTIERDGTNIILRWNRATFRLEGTTALGGTWGSITGASPKTVDAATGLQFFRLVCP